MTTKLNKAIEESLVRSGIGSITTKRSCPKIKIGQQIKADSKKFFVLAYQRNKNKTTTIVIGNAR